jgi:hypothetical protein
MSIGQEADRRPGGRLRMDAAHVMVTAALGIMFLALLLAAAAVQGATLPIDMPQGPTDAGTVPSLVLQDEHGALVALSPEAAAVTARVDALAARVAVEHRFRTGPGTQRSGVYILPLPQDAEPRRVTVSVGERRVEIGLAIERTDVTPELLALPVSGIGPHSEVSVELVYDRPVSLGGGRFVLALPLAHGRSAEPEVSDARWSAGRSPLELELDPGLPIAELRSPSHGIDIRRGPGEHRRILLADSESPTGRDFVLVWKPADPRASVAALRRFTAAGRKEGLRTEEALLMRTRSIGRAVALVPAVAQPALLTGAPIDGGAILTAIAARSGATPAATAAMPSSALIAAILAIWALGSFYLASRRGGREHFPATSSIGTLR